MNRHYQIFFVAFLFALTGEFAAILMESAVLLDVSICVLLYVCLMWLAVYVSDRRAARERRRAMRRQGARR